MWSPLLAQPIALANHGTMFQTALYVWAAFALTTLGCCQDSRPASNSGDTATDFVRFTELNANDALFELNWPRYRDPKGREVSLISAVHIADPSHYQACQKEFTLYDAVLYELVAEAGSRPKKGRKANDPLTLLQHAMKTGLELEFQLDGVDYSPANFIHADLDPDTFQEKMAERGESLIALLLRAAAHQSQVQRDKADDPDAEKGPAQPDLVKAFRNREGRHLLRMSLARQLEDLEAIAIGFSGSKGEGSVLLEGRNEKAIDVLKQELKTEKRSFAIYYGAAHMPDMEQRLFALGFAKTADRWVIGWDIHKRLDPVKKPKKKD